MLYNCSNFYRLSDVMLPMWNLLVDMLLMIWSDTLAWLNCSVQNFTSNLFALLFAICRLAMIFPNLRAHLYWTSFYRLVTLLMNCHLSSSTRTRLIEDQPIMYIRWHYYSLNTLLLLMFNDFLDVNWLVSWIVCSLCKMVIQPEWATFMPSQYLSEWYETNLTFFFLRWIKKSD